MSIILSGISYHYINQSSIFENISLSVATGRKVSVIGNNGTGKSTLLKLIAGELNCSSGSVSCCSHPWYIPQQTGISGVSVGEALGVADKLEAFYAICNGSPEQCYYDRLSDDWEVEARCRSALDEWGLADVELTASVDSLSGGEKTKLFLAGIGIHKPGIILLDEPTNHLDASGRRKLYDLIRSSNVTIVVVSHDRVLLDMLEETYELSPKGIKLYGGNYEFYRQQKEMEDTALEQQISAEQTALRLARKKAREVSERQEKRSRQGEKNKDQLPRIMRKFVKDSGEKMASRLKEKHQDIIGQNRQRLEELRQQQQLVCGLKIDIEDVRLHRGKLLIEAKGINFGYTDRKELWQEPVDLEIRSGERIHLKGDNGSGKTTLIRLLTGELKPGRGEVMRADFSYVYLDQEYSKVNTSLTVLELAEKYNLHHLEDHELKLRLHRALFPQDMWDKKCNVLSGGERMRLYLCCLMISNQIPDLFILDEPTNNLDLSGLAVLTNTIQDYRGTLLVISHDEYFIQEIGINRTIVLR